MQKQFNMYIVASLFLMLSVNVLLLNIVVFSRLSKPGELAIEEPAYLRPEETAVQTKPEAVHEFETYSEDRIIPKEADVTQAYRGPQQLYIPVGSGSVMNTEWTPIPAAQVAVDTSLYPEISKVVFEVYMHIPTGNGRMWVKLYNETQKHDVWFSELSAVGHEISRQEAAVTLDPGNNVYAIYAKGSMPYSVSVDNARIVLKF